jgi:hypothetical protein
MGGVRGRGEDNRGDDEHGRRGGRDIGQEATGPGCVYGCWDVDLEVGGGDKASKRMRG